MKESFSLKMEKKLGKYAIRNITFYLIICYAFGYIIELINPEFLSFLTLEPSLILKGQVWRLFTWLIIPPDTSNLFFVLIMLYFYYSIGRSLEAVWGTYRLNVYLFSGMFYTIVGSFILYFIFRYVTMIPNPVGYGLYFSTYYINMSIFLAYAATFPDMQVLLFFIVPIKVKVLGIIYGILLLVSCIQGGVVTWVVIGSSLLNFIVFFFTSRKRVRLSPKQVKQRVVYKREVKKQDAARFDSGIAKHKCAVCGRTDKTNPELEFRFCSKCNGNYEYCQDHLFTHEHKK